jgi:hypothetical protein
MAALCTAEAVSELLGFYDASVGRTIDDGLILGGSERLEARLSARPVELTSPDHDLGPGALVNGVRTGRHRVASVIDPELGFIDNASALDLACVSAVER